MAHDLAPLFRPRAVAVVGASPDRSKLGHVVLANMLRAGYPGRLLPVNPRAREIAGLPCYPDVAAAAAAVRNDVGRLDLAVIVVPSGVVPDVAEQCGAAGVRTLVVISAGFRETGRDGAAAEARLVDACRRHGMRMVGPNSLGVMDTHTPINASFAANFPLRGELAFVSQSGALCAAILDWSRQRGMGFSQFVSMGNKADLDESDLLAAASDDPKTRAVLCYIEDVHDGRRFLESVRAAAARKPIIVLKSGRSAAGARAASSHTGALAGSDRAYEAAFLQTGVLRAAHMQELFDLAEAFARMPLPRGDRVGIVTNSGGPGILASDAVEQAGLRIASLDRATVDRLRAELPRAASLYNPVDLIGDATAERYAFALDVVAADPGVNLLLVMLTPTAVADAASVARALVAARAKFPSTPCAAVFMGGALVEPGNRILAEAGIPSYFAPERAVAALAGLVRYRRARDRLRTPGEPSGPAGRADARAAVASVLAGVRAERRTTLLGSEAARVARAYGLPAAATELVRTPEEAAAAARRMGLPCALKVASPKILHKTDVGGVRLNVRAPADAATAFIDILESVHRHLGPVPVHGVEVQAMAPPGRECIVGMSRDPTFGPLVMFGLGGIYVNLLQDVSFRLALGLDEAEIERQIAETRAHQLLRGARGEPPADLGAARAAVARVAALSLDFPEIAEIDVNPLFVYRQGEGALALDVKVTLSPPGETAPGRASAPAAEAVRA